VEAIPREVRILQTRNGREPFAEWLKSLGPEPRSRVRIALNKLSNGNIGNVKSVGEGVSELRIDFGPGYRIYFGQFGMEVHLITGGDKSSQVADIAYAKKLWCAND
jgi:putative addiction module killer protein